MSLVNRKSEISIVCDCPYSGKTCKINENSESERNKKNQLLGALKKTNEDLSIARHVLMDTRSKLAMLQRILSMEFGYVVNPYIMTEATWKNRVREESYLKSELIHLVDYLRECDPRYHKTIDLTTLSASTEDLLSAVQEKTLKRIYHDYTVYHSDVEKQIGSSLWEFFQLKENYENKLYQNKVMEQEIITTKKKIFNLQMQFLENKSLIDYITNHHFKMAGCFLHFFPKENLPKKVNGKRHLDSESLKFKKLWEDSKLQKRMMLDSVSTLKMNLENIKQRIIEAENLCSRNIRAFRTFAKKLKEGAILGKIQPKKMDTFCEISLIPHRSQRIQLEAAINENRYLKVFLRKAILSKTEDLKEYRQSLQSNAERYRKILEDIRGNIIEKAMKEKEVTEKKKKK